MKFSAKTEYACLAMLQLAHDHLTGTPTPIRTISDRQSIPEGFLVQILQELRRSGLVTSTRGSCGGYRLSRPAGEVSLAEVISAIEGEDNQRSATDGASPLADALRTVCDELQQSQQDQLGSLSLADLLDRAAAPSNPMWYI